MEEEFKIISGKLKAYIGSDEIKNCPFCGSLAIHPENRGLERKGFESYALNCEHCNSSSGSYTHLHQAIEAWNKRN